jgi:hypothetical protein
VDDSTKDAIKEFTKLMKVRSTPQLIPTDQYQLSNTIISTEKKNEMESDIIGKPSDIVDKEVLLSCLSNDKVLNIYQGRVRTLRQMYDIARRETDLRFTYAWMRDTTKNQLMITRAKNNVGTVGLIQSIAGSSSNATFRPDEGYGSGFPQDQQQEKKGGILDKIFNKNKNNNNSKEGFHD